MIKYLGFLAILLSIFAYSFAATCFSVGDPHVQTFGRVPLHLYGSEGVFWLLRSKNLAVQTKVRYGQHWGVRGLNTAIAIYVDGNKFIHSGDKYTINGAVNGQLANLKGGCTITKTGGNRYFIKASTGEQITFDFFNAPTNNPNKWPKYYFNVYVNVPGTGSTLFGLCNYKNGQNVQVYAAKPNQNLFTHFLNYHHNSGPVKHVNWKSNADRLAAERYCSSLFLSKALYHDCLTDIRESGGDIKAASGYKNSAYDLDDIKNHASLKKKYIALAREYLAKAKHYRGLAIYHYKLYRTNQQRYAHHFHLSKQYAQKATYYETKAKEYLKLAQKFQVQITNFSRQRNHYYNLMVQHERNYRTLKSQLSIASSKRAAHQRAMTHAQKQYIYFYNQYQKWLKTFHIQRNSYNQWSAQERNLGPRVAAALRAYTSYKNSYLHFKASAEKSTIAYNTNRSAYVKNNNQFLHFRRLSQNNLGIANKYLAELRKQRNLYENYLKQANHFFALYNQADKLAQHHEWHEETGKLHH